MKKKKIEFNKFLNCFFLKKAPKEEDLLSWVCEHSVCLWQRSGEGRRTDTEKMNSGILNIKDDRVPQQLLLFIFLWKHLDTHIHLYSCHTPSFSPSPSVSSCHTLSFLLSRSPSHLASARQATATWLGRLARRRCNASSYTFSFFGKC